MYFFTMKIMFQKNPVDIHKPPIPKEKHQSLLHAIGGGWYMNKLSEKILPLEKNKIIKKSQKKEDEIKINLQMANQNWNYWKFEIH